jgi:hypothetical protein
VLPDLDGYPAGTNVELFGLEQDRCGVIPRKVCEE